ncbi:MAG: DUF2304 domain-containing protein [Oscillospiraceae bacterium]|nr:DUF2304 domain-containing protein [Oscillospiraceae bacterium]MBQ8612564.1 DUF2304 domain-containing protein [Oscillospiraceae bacterium]
MEYLVWQIRLLLVLCSVGAFVFVMKYIRKSRVKIEHTIFWILMCIILLVMSIFPQIPYWLSGLLRIESPANFVFLFLIALLLVNQFFTTMRLSHTEIRLQELVQEVALMNGKNVEKKEETDEETQE